MTTRVILGCSERRDYAFPLPLTALFWREVIGHSPYCVLTDTEEFWLRDHRRNQAVIDALKEMEIDYEFIGNIDGYEPGNVAQNVREHGAAVPFPDDDWLMPGDVDLWPLQKGFFNQHQNSGKLCVWLYSNGDNFVSKEDVLQKYTAGLRAQTLPTCFGIMRARTWRDLYGITQEDDIARATKRTMDWWLRPRIAGKAPSEIGWISHMSDQDILTYKVCAAEWFPSDALLIERRGHPPMDRIDRGVADSWTMPLEDAVDAHLWRAPEEPNQWPSLMRIIKHFMPQHAQFAEEYRNSYWMLEQ